jgi:Fic family protein
VDIPAALAEVRALPPRGAIAREAALLRRDELVGSLAIAGTPLTPAEIGALLDRGVALGGHRLEAFVTVRDLAAAAAWVAEHRAYRPEDRRPLLLVEEVRRLHQIACAGEASEVPGAWRLTVSTLHEVVSPAPWLVPFEVASLVEHVRIRPEPPLLPRWIAAFLTRFARVRPFTHGNGRVARLAVGLLLRRSDPHLPSLAVARDDAAAYRAALQAATGGDRLPLERLVGTTLVAACNRIVAAAGGGLVPLRVLAGEDYPRLIKAARRGRLRVVVRDGRVASTAAWVAAYRTAPPRM